VKLGLGTAQFGLDYGVTNNKGRVAQDNVRGIIALAEQRGFELLDTAAAYGSSEEVIGAVLRPSSSMRIVTKTPVFRCERISDAEVNQLNATLWRSLQRLRRRNVYGLLLHNADNLSLPGGKLLLEAMRKAVFSGLVAKIGVSVYRKEQIDSVLDVFTPDILQCPVSIFDQRLVRSGHLATLKRLGVEIHARSLFLQGLLLGEEESLPDALSCHRAHFHRYFSQLAALGVGKVEAAVGFIRSQPNVDVAVVGVTELRELEQIVDAALGEAPSEISYADFALDDLKAIDPSTWNLKARG